jgi:hypothetical protein
VRFVLLVKLEQGKKNPSRTKRAGLPSRFGRQAVKTIKRRWWGWGSATTQSSQRKQGKLEAFLSYRASGLRVERINLSQRRRSGHRILGRKTRKTLKTRARETKKVSALAL